MVVHQSSLLEGQIIRTIFRLISLALVGCWVNIKHVGPLCTCPNPNFAGRPLADWGLARGKEHLKTGDSWALLSLGDSEHPVGKWSEKSPLAGTPVVEPGKVTEFLGLPKKLSPACFGHLLLKRQS